MRILVTGASGCIGHYICEALIEQTDHELFLLVRDPAKLQIDVNRRPNVNVLTVNLRDLEPLQALLPTINQAVLTATAWGDPTETYDLNVTKTLALIQALDPQVCEQILYFSTASLLSREQTLLPEAGEIGTDYIRTKYQCFEKLQQLESIPKVVTVFPTLVVGGDEHKPTSHLSSGIPEVMRWAGLLRFLKLEGSFHFIHGRDIAQVICHLVQHPEAAPVDQLVLGNRSMSANEFIEAICEVCDRKSFFKIDLSPTLANIIIKLFNIQMADWDRFCLDYRHFSYPNPINPKTFGLSNYCSTLTDLLRRR
ncbi:MAG: NAD-dependent epimerase/dehydratase family protein [Thermosynechococcaceae cyanobacterium]